MYKDQLDIPTDGAFVQIHFYDQYRPSDTVHTTIFSASYKWIDGELYVYNTLELRLLDVYAEGEMEDGDEFIHQIENIGAVARDEDHDWIRTGTTEQMIDLIKARIKNNHGVIIVIDPEEVNV